MPFIILFSCKKENFDTSPSSKLSFSTDTIFFDTIFTTIGSTTKQFKIYNPNSKIINVSQIKLARGDNSPYRLNINGYTTSELEDVEIEANDSLFIFVEVTIDPNKDEMIEQDSIVFVTNGNMQDVDLVSFGQDVHLINGEIFYNDTIWTSNIPHLVYNSMLIDSTKTLTIEAGTEIYFHHNSGMLVKGTLIVNGTVDEPVEFKGDRLELGYEDIPGQWGGIRLYSGSGNHKINYGVIRNAVVGIQVGTLEPYSGESLTITNSIIENMNYAGIYAYATTINAFNCVIAECGFYNAALLVGGNYNFYHCSFPNYWHYANRSTPAVVLTNSIELQTGTYLGDLNEANFKNCIIHGSNDNEIGFSEMTGADFNYMFESCIAKINPADIDTTNGKFNNIYIKNSSDNLFIDIDEFDYQLDTLSFAKDKADISIINNFGFIFDLSKDLLNESRISDSAPDLGAYERIE